MSLPYLKPSVIVGLDSTIKIKNVFDEILKLNKNSADAYYSLGLIYEKQGEMVKARAEWRKALKAQVNHPGALAKMSANR